MIPRLSVINSWRSSVLLGRFVATGAELGFVAHLVDVPMYWRRIGRQRVGA
jgi:hypothetical protein